MVFQEKIVMLKDGRNAVLRCPSLSDASEMVEYLRRSCGETEYLLRYPEEIAYTEDGERAYIQNCLDSSDSLMIVCTVNNMIAGNCQLVRRDGVKTRHRATVMIALLQDFWARYRQRHVFGNGTGSKRAWHIPTGAGDD